MTVASDIQDVTYNTDGSTVDFPIPFYFLRDGDVRADMILASGIAQPLVLGTDFTLTGAGNPAGGMLSTLSVITTGNRLHIYRDVPATQETQYQQNDPFPAKTTERALDKLTMLVQRLFSRTGLAIQYPAHELGKNAVLPVASVRAKKPIVFDQNGNVGVGAEPYQEPSAILSQAYAFSTNLYNQTVAMINATRAYAEQLVAGVVGGYGFYQRVNGRQRTFQDKMNDALAAADYAVGGTANDTAAFARLASQYPNAVVNLGGQIYRVDAVPTGNIYRNGGFLVGGKIRWTHEPTTFFGRAGACSYYGGQLRALKTAIADPLYQLVSVTFVGDSITWGSGQTGIENTEPRNGTLGDPRDNAATGSYVNNLKRWFAERLGPAYAVTTTHADWPYATPGAGNGQAITTHTRLVELGFLDVGPFTYAVTGGASHSSFDSPTTITGVQRRFTVPQGGTGSISFAMTGEQFTFVFDGTNFSDRYNVYVNGAMLAGSPFDMNAARIGQASPYYNFKRNHAFPFVRGATVKIQFIPSADGTSSSAVYAGAIEVPKQIRVKNQGINGATSHSYWMYNFPTSKVNFPPEKKVESQFGATIVGSGNVVKTTVAAPSSATGEQVQLDMYQGGTFNVTCPIPAGCDALIVGYSQIGNGTTVNVMNGGTQIDSFSTAGAPPTYGLTRLVRFAAGTSSIVLQTVADPNNHIGVYLEGLVAFDYSSAVNYPTNNSFGKGVALDNKDSFCFFQLGTNDRIQSTGPNYPTQSSTANKLPRMLDLLPDGCKAIVMCANPALNDGPPTYWGSMFDIRNQLDNIAMTKGCDFIDHTEMLRGVPPMAFTSDGLHPFELGSRLMSSNVEEAINRA
ncbi:hypothetical protein LGM71_17775 [Burkholderia sp. AU33545]|uniref:SGNH/GDSL hydrolase family protein n=1 Tax=Burkholderia sp. AU33545 TaxID=2879631 RepID=UPI001CF40D14|nr:SGNH/GDSL hydrolase family protein [Burkholderia sp. AU33545]MCA8202911.1 hypothetical protein [Burkholderia sp. AU33545]